MAAKSKPSTTRDSLSKVRDHIQSVETRLDAASKANKRAVSALKSSLESLGQHSGTQADTIKAQTDKIATHLNGMIAQTRSDISKDLKTALANPRLDVITNALSHANTKLTQAEIRQAEAIQKVNQQIARLASTLDARMSAETQARKALDVSLTERIDAVASSTAQRITDIETQTASAITDIGERVVTLSDELNKNAETLQQGTHERIYEIALESQQEFETFKSDTQRRMEGLEEETHNQLTPLSRQVATLAARLEAVEMGVTSSVSSADVNAIPPFPTAPAMTHAATHAEMDAFSPEPATILQNPVLAPNPVTSEAAQAMPYPSTSDQDIASEAGPVEFQPEIYAAPHAQNAYAAHNNVMPFAPPALNVQAPPMAADYDYNAAGEPVTLDHGYATNPYDTGSAPLNDSNPYGTHTALESDDSMSAARPGAPEKGKASFISKRLLRTGASAAAIVAIAAFGGLMVKDKLMGSGTPDMAQNSNGLQHMDSDPNATAPWQDAKASAENYDVTLQAPTGQIASSDGTVSKLSTAVNAEPKTLDAAVEAGNSVAQLQKGLALMQEGRKEDAASLIRLAANQGQPAAQYYLGHMYENGDGLAADSTQARKLTEMAAKSGHRIAMYDVALYYIEGKGGVDVNMNTAAQWFRKAAEFGMVDAQYNLAVLHERGTGVPLDLAESYVWFTIAGKNGDQDSAQRAGQLKLALDGDALGRAEARIAGFSPSQIDNEVNGIFANVAWNKTAPARDETVAKVQESLGALGYSAGIADGAMGPNTRKAIQAFERENGLPESGEVNDALLERLSAATGA